MRQVESVEAGCGEGSRKKLCAAGRVGVVGWYQVVYCEFSPIFPIERGARGGDAMLILFTGATRTGERVMKNTSK